MGANTDSADVHNMFPKPITPKEIYKYYISGMETPAPERDGGNLVNRMASETTVFDTHGKTLTFVGTVHFQGEGPYTHFLSELLGKTKPELLLVEERDDTAKSRYKEYIEEKQRAAWTEVDWLINWANGCGVPVGAMDPPASKMFDPFTELNDSDAIKAGLLIKLMWNYHNPYLGLPDELPGADWLGIAVRATITELTPPWGAFSKGRFRDALFSLKDTGPYKGLSSDSFIRTVAQEAVDKYVKAESLVSALEDPDVNAPFPHSRKYGINRMYAWINASRDASMIAKCVTNMKTYERTVAVAGMGHIQGMRGFLERAISEEFGGVATKRFSEA